MKELLGLLLLYRRLRKMGYGVLITAVDTATNQAYSVSILNDGTVSPTSTGTVKIPGRC